MGDPYRKTITSSDMWVTKACFPVEKSTARLFTTRTTARLSTDWSASREQSSNNWTKYDESYT